MREDDRERHPKKETVTFLTVLKGFYRCLAGLLQVYDLFWGMLVLAKR